MSEEIRKSVFSYDEITEEHKDAALEIMNLLNQMGQPMIAEMIKHKFKIVEKPKFDLNNSPVHNSLTADGFFLAVQGYVGVGEGADAIDYPVVCINEDIRKLDAWFHKVMSQK